MKSRPAPISGDPGQACEKTRWAGPRLLPYVQSLSPGGRDAPTQSGGGHEINVATNSMTYATHSFKKPGSSFTYLAVRN